MENEKPLYACPEIGTHGRNPVHSEGKISMEKMGVVHLKIKEIN